MKFMTAFASIEVLTFSGYAIRKTLQVNLRNKQISWLGNIPFQ
jgi:hypothetical protein